VISELPEIPQPVERPDDKTDGQQVKASKESSHGSIRLTDWAYKSDKFKLQGKRKAPDFSGASSAANDRFATALSLAGTKEGATREHRVQALHPIPQAPVFSHV